MTDSPNSAALPEPEVNTPEVTAPQLPPPDVTPDLVSRFTNAVGDILERARALLAMREDNLFLLLAVIIGLFSGVAVVCFRIAIDDTRLFLLGSSPAPGPLRVILVPTLAGLVLAVLVLRIFPRVRGSGVTHTKSAVYIYEGYIPFETVIGKFIACALSIGSGQSLGPEDPSLQMGAGIASALGRRLHLSREKVRLIAPVGAAAGLAAAFNAPITAVVFVIEEVIGTWSAGILGAVVLAAVSAVVVSRWFLGAEPLFQVPPYRMVHPAELVTYAVLGVAGGLCSHPLRQTVLVLQGTIPSAAPLDGLPSAGHGRPPDRHHRASFSAGDGRGLRLDGSGHAWPVFVARHSRAGLLKIVATSLSASSGAPGGMFAPTLFVGSHDWSGRGHLAAPFFPGLHGSAGVVRACGHGHVVCGLFARSA